MASLYHNQPRLQRWWRRGSGGVTLEELVESVVLRGKEKNKLSLGETCRAMADESEDWSDFEAVTSDGLE